VCLTCVGSVPPGCGELVVIGDGEEEADRTGHQASCSIFFVFCNLVLNLSLKKEQINPAKPCRNCVCRVFF